MYKQNTTPKTIFGEQKQVFKDTLHYSHFIEDNQLCIHVESIQVRLGYIDKIRFRRTIAKSINGQIKKVFEIRNHLIYLYVQNHTNKYARTLLLDKIEILKNIIKVSNVTDLWIIQDTNFLCIGLVQGAPVFWKSFEVIMDVVDNLDTLIQSINEYGPIETVRTFGMNHINFPAIPCQCYEYSTEFMAQNLNGSMSLNNYCKGLYQLAKSNTKRKAIYISITIILSIGAFFARMLKNNLQKEINDMREELAILNNNHEIPTIQHYHALMALEKK